MTVTELIKHLNNFPPELPVRVIPTDANFMVDIRPSDVECMEVFDAHCVVIWRDGWNRNPSSNGGG